MKKHAAHKGADAETGAWLPWRRNIWIYKERDSY